LGARSFELNIDTGWGSMLPAVGQPLLPDALHDAVADAGFELLHLELEVLGQLHGPAGEGQVSVKVESSGQRFALVEGSSEPERAAWSQLSPQLGRSGAPFWVRGRALERADGTTALEVVDFRFPAD
jgi:hypothetical protein